MKNGKFSYKKVCILFVLAGFAAAAFFYCMASTLNPWSQKLPNLDSAVWLRCAVEMIKGKVIYRDTWDHKGPVLFLIQYLGLRLVPHSLTGLWILECIFTFMTLWAFYLTAGLFTESMLVRFLAAVLSLQPYYYFFQQGNCVEEWSLPFISFSLYFFVRFLKTLQLVRWEIFLAGVCMGFSFLLNGNLIAVWVCFVPLTALLLLCKKRYRDLLTCALWFAGGLLLILLTAAGVLLLQGAWSAFVEAYFGFNYSYTSGVTWNSFRLSVLNFAYIDRWFGYFNVLLFLLLAHERRADWKWCFLPYSILSLVLLSVSGRGYIHYGLQLIPCMIIPVSECVERLRAWCRKYSEFVFIVLLVSVLWLRFDAEDYSEKLIRWTTSTEGENDYAGGDTENYTIVNDWIGGRWSEEAIDKWVTNEIY